MSEMHTVPSVEPKPVILREMKPSARHGFVFEHNRNTEPTGLQDPLPVGQLALCKPKILPYTHRPTKE
jgi:hypothetical protein